MLEHIPSGVRRSAAGKTAIGMALGRGAMPTPEDVLAF
jgi:hypothetical protein